MITSSPAPTGGSYAHSANEKGDWSDLVGTISANRGLMGQKVIKARAVGRKTRNSERKGDDRCFRTR